MNYYPRFPAHYQTKTLHLTMEQDGAYTRLLDWYYANERPVPHVQRYAIARAMTPSERRSVDAVLEEFFERCSDDWRQARCDAEIEKARPKLDAARANGAKGGRPKKANPEGAGHGTQQKPTGFPPGFANGTQHEPGAKAPQSPIPSSPPEGEHTPEPTQGAQPAGGVGVSGPGAAAAALNRLGVRITSLHPDLIAACAEGVTTDDLLELQRQYPDKSGPYLVAAARRMRADNPSPVTGGTANGTAHPQGRPCLADRVADANRVHDERERAASG